jgi:hypothetical protein
MFADQKNYFYSESALVRSIRVHPRAMYYLLASAAWAAASLAIGTRNGLQET